jgi:probable HAF family extracellular repeat protein
VSSYTPISVASADPAEGEQGTTLEVRITGAGFLDDAVPTWERDGVADTLIVVDEVVFVSDTELLAMVRIGLETDLGPYDVAVRSSRKKGIGSEDPVGVGEGVFEVVPYAPQALGQLGEVLWSGNDTYASALNNHGMVVGSGARGAIYTSQAVYWTETEGIVEFDDREGSARAVNDKGWIVGYRDSDKGVGFDAFIYEDGVMTVLEGLDTNEPYQYSFVAAINEAGTIVGWGGRDYWSDPVWPVVWQRDASGAYGPANELPLRPGEQWKLGDRMYARAWGINARGDVVGEIMTTGTPIFWRARPDGSYEDPLELPGGVSAIGIDDAGWILGRTDEHRAVLWLPEDYNAPVYVQTRIFPRGINNSGQIVGAGVNGGLLLNVDATGVVTDIVELLPVDGGSSGSPTAVNDSSWVVGRTCYEATTVCEATLWRPNR